MSIQTNQDSLEKKEQEHKINTNSNEFDEDYYKSVHSRYEAHKHSIKSEKDDDLNRALFEVSKDIEAASNGSLIDARHIQMLFGTYLPEYFKLLFSRRFIPKDAEQQLLITQFANTWMKYRVPIISEYYAHAEDRKSRDIVHKYVPLNKELDILAIIFDENIEMYNYRICKNTTEIEEKLSKIYEQVCKEHANSNSMSDSNSDAFFAQKNQDVAYPKKQMASSFYYVHNINMLSLFGGFDQFLKLLQPINSPLTKPNFHTYLVILTMITNMKGYLYQMFWQEYAEKVKDACISYAFSNLSQEDLRNVQKKDLSQFTAHIESLLSSLNQNPDEKTEKVFCISENIELMIALKCLKLPVLEKKMIGHSILTMKIVQARTNTLSQQSQQIQGKSLNLQMNRRWLTQERLTEWMDKEKIFELIFGDSLHSEVIKKSYSLLQFLYQNERIQKKEIDIIWHCATKKHEAYKVAIMKALTFLSSKFSIDHLSYLFQKLKSLHMNEIDKFSLALIRAIARRLSNSDYNNDKQVSHIGGLVRSSSHHEKQNRKHSDGNFTKNLFGGNPLNDDVVMFDENDDIQGLLGTSNLKGEPTGGINTHGLFGLDDMAGQLNAGDNKRRGKKTRSLSLNGENDSKKPASSLITKISDGMSQQKQMKEEQKGPELHQQQYPLHQHNYEEEKLFDIIREPQNEENPLEVPAEKEDKKTADEEGSAGGLMGGEGEDVIMRDNDIFDHSMRDFSNNLPESGLNGNQKKKDAEDFEEEKDDGTSKRQLHVNMHELLHDESLGIENAQQRDLAYQVLNYMWSMCLEDQVIDHQLSLQNHKLAIDHLVQTLAQNYPQAVFLFIQKCSTCLQHNYSVLSVQTVLQRLISGLSFPLDQGKQLAKNKLELIQRLEEELNITNECLSSYIEFKRVSLSYIFDQIGSQEQEQENLETQSSLDNDDDKSLMQSAQKNTTNEQQQQQTQNRNDHISIQIDNNIQSMREPQGAIFVSPKNRIEEEFKIFQPPTKSQSYQVEKVQQNQQQFTDFTMSIKESEQDERSQRQAVGSMGSMGSSSKQFGSSAKRIGGVQQSHFTQARSEMQQNQNIIQGPELQQEAQQNNAATNANNSNNNNNNRDFLNQLITNEVYKYSYYQEMHHRLDFLKFMIGNCPGILKPQQIQVLWECLVINAFYEKERDMFFQWCTQILKAAQNIPGIKDQDQMGASIFKDDCLEMLFFDTLLKLDFRYITEIMYECFERFFIYINEQYGQIVTNRAFDSAFEVFETKLIGVEGLWEITLCARTDKVYKRAADFLHKLYKKMSPSLIDKLNEIKEDLLQTCMDQIKTGLNDIHQELGDAFEVPLYQFATSIEDPKNRIARSIQQLCKFIEEFEGLRDKSAKSSLGQQDKEVKLVVHNQISSSNGPKKIEINVPLTLKVGELREQVAKAIHPPRQTKEINLLYKGKDMNEDLKTIKDLGMLPEAQCQIFASLRNDYEMEIQNKIEDQANNEFLIGQAEQLKDFLGCVDLPQSVIILALKKCNMNMEEAIIMLTDEDQINDLQDEIRKQEEMNQHIALIDDAPKEEGQVEDSKLNLIISNRSEYFELLFDLLNLGINEITTAAWNLLIQIPVNKQLLQQIKTLNPVQGHEQNWNQIIDSTNVYKMLYSLQIFNSLISVNNDALSEAEIQERFEWRQRFLEFGGFNHLYSILISSEVDDLLSNQQANSLILQAKLIGSGGKRKQKGNKSKVQQPMPYTSDQKEQQQIQNNSAKCLGYLISIIKIFLQAALLTTDEEKLLTLIVQSSTSPFRKHKNITSALSAVPQGKIQMIFNGSGSGGMDISREDLSRDTSSVNTPKFHSSNSSTPQQCHTPQEEGQSNKGAPEIKTQNKSIENVKADISQTTFSKNPNEQVQTQVDDFPKLVEQMSGGLALNLLDKVVNFNELISKLLHIIYKAVMFCDSADVSQLVQNSLDLLLSCVVWRPNLLLKEIYEFEHIETLLIRTLMFNQNENIRKSLERTFKVICTQLDLKSDKAQEQTQFLPEDAANVQIESPKSYILKILLKNLPDINQKSEQCEEYFNLTTSLIKACQSNFKVTDFNTQEKKHIIIEDGFSANGLLQWCVYQLKNRPTYEDRYSQYTDKVLAGYLQLTQSVLEIYPELKKYSISENNKLVKTVFDFLFLLPSLEDQQQKHSKNIKQGAGGISQDTYPKCKRKFTRKKAFNLLITLCQNNEENFIELLQQLYLFHSQIQKSQKVVNLSEFDNEVGMRSSSGYVGLKNFGCTCFMNSLIQQLFMIPDFRKGVLQTDVLDDDPENNILYQLKLIFANLQESEKQYYAPGGFTKAFKWYGEPINVRAQQDTHEFYNMLCDYLEHNIKGTVNEKLLKETIGGVIVNQTKSLEKEHPFLGEREEPFLSITLDIKNKKNISEALDLYIKPDILEGDNKYMCEKYNKKINVQRRSFLKKLSNTVIINLKRFEFDYNTMQKLKVNDYCEFPMKINFKPWTKEGIKEQEQKQFQEEQKQKQQRKSGTQEDLEEDELNIIEESGKLEDLGELIDIDSQGEEDNGSYESCYYDGQQEENKRGGDAIDEEMESVGEEFEIGQTLNTGQYIDDGGVEDLMDINGDEYEEMTSKSKKQKGTKQTAKVLPKGKDQKNGIKKKPKRKQLKDEQYYDYELVGVLVHSGSADSGHYYSFIKERGSANRWLEFNDIHVREFDLKNLEAECFGGNNENRGPQPSAIYDDFNPADARFFERCRNAYLLLYEKVHPTNPNEQQVIPTSVSSNVKMTVNGIESNIYEKIWEENAAFMKLKIFFDTEYFSFLREYVNLYNFENVLYFSQDKSQCLKQTQLKELSEQYRSEYPNLTIDYKQRQQAIESQAKLNSENDIFREINNIKKDPGLYTLKLATILSQDIITKVKDVQSFVQWMQLLHELYQRHAVACVWFVKYLTENRGLLEELLLNTNSFEARESFSKLLTTALSVTAKNEESYFFQNNDIIDFDCDLSRIQSNHLEVAQVSKASVIRFMELYFNTMLDGTRVHWRRFDDYFIVLKDFIQLGFNETKYIIDQQGIVKLLEFCMNCSPPFLDRIKFKMGDRVNDVNFTQVVDTLSILIKSCLTRGIQYVSQYSPVSKYQTDDKHINLPQNEISHLITKECFTYDLLPKSQTTNNSLQDIVVHLSWGDSENSKFFIDEIVESCKQKRVALGEVENHLKILGEVLKLKNDELQEMRFISFFSYDHAADKSLFKYLYSLKDIATPFVLKLLSFIGDLCEQIPKTKEFILREENDLKTWIFTFLMAIRNNKNINSMSWSSQMNPQQTALICYEQFANILQDQELQSKSFGSGMDHHERMFNDSLNDVQLQQQPQSYERENLAMDTSFRETDFGFEMPMEEDIHDIELDKKQHATDNDLN